MKNNNDSLFKILKFFLLSSISALAFVLLFSGFSYVKINSNQMLTGEDGATLALAHNEQTLELQIDKKKAAAINLPPHEKIDFILGANPVYWLGMSIYELILSL